MRKVRTVYFGSISHSETRREKAYAKTRSEARIIVICTPPLRHTVLVEKVVSKINKHRFSLAQPKIA